MKKRILAIMIGAMLALSACGAEKVSTDNEVSVEVSENKGEESNASSTADKDKDKSAAAESDSKNDLKDADKTQTDTQSETKADDKTEAVEKNSESAGDSKSDNSKESTEAKSEDTTKATESSKSEEASKTTESSKSEDTTKSTESARTEETAKTAEPAKTEAPAKTDYGRIVFVGDSRTVDMFSGDVSRIYGEVHDGITVYAEDARDYSFLIEVMGSVGTENFDTLISWMGANDYGNFANYQPHYEGLLREGKRIILCTVGPTLDSALASDFDRSHYTNDLQVAYNNSLVAWANANGVKVIDLYSYLAGNTDITIDPADGIHYQPRPTGAIWGRIVSSLNR